MYYFTWNIANGYGGIKLDSLWITWNEIIKIHIKKPKEVTAVKNPPCIESLASDVTTQIKAIKFKKLEITVNKPGAVFKYPKSNILLEKNLKGGVKCRWMTDNKD